MRLLLNFLSIQIKPITLTILGSLLAVIVLAKEPVLSPKDLASPPPKIIRTCCSFGSDVSMAGIPFVKYNDITCIEDIGPHQYLGNKEEMNGNIYTQRGGFIDLGHVRDCADWTAFLSCYILKEQKEGHPIQLDLGREGGMKKLSIELPEKFSKNQVYELAGKIAYDLSLWHEIATWFGVSYVPFVPERYSSFSPEDLYSNLLGIQLGIQALKSDLEYEAAMTLLIEKTLTDLQSVETLEATYAAMDKVESIWWTRKKRLPSKKILIKRYFDSEASLLPWLIPNVEGEYMPYRLDKLDHYLSDLYQLEIKLNYKFPLRAMANFPNDRIISQHDFGILQNYIIKEVTELEYRIAIRTQRKKERKENKVNKRTSYNTILPMDKKTGFRYRDHKM